MTNVFGEGLDYEIDTEDVLNEVDAKIKMMNIVNEKKFVNVTGDVIESLQIKNNPVNDLDAINLKYIKKLEVEYQNEKLKNSNTIKKQNEEISKLKQEMQKLINTQEKKLKLEIIGQIANVENKLTMQEKNLKSEIVKQNEVIKTENAKQTEYIEKLKTENEKYKSEIKSDYEKFKSGSEYVKYKNEIDISIMGYRNKIIDLNNQVTELEKKFNLLNKNITKWHGTVENRLKTKKAV